VAFVLERDYGLMLPRWMQVELAQIVQRESEADNGEIGSERIHTLFLEHFAGSSHPFALDGYRLDRRDGIDAIEAQVVRYGRVESIRGTGEGAIEAFVNACASAYGVRINVVDYSEHTLGTDTSAEAVAYVQLNLDGQRSAGVAFDRDTVSASMRAVLASMNCAQLPRAAA
jgi:2-isopropylmalate synthase